MNPFEEDYSTRENLLRGMDQVFAAVSGWWEHLHEKPMDCWVYGYDDYWHKASNGAYVSTSKYDGKSWEKIALPETLAPVCDDKRECGGVMDRYLAAHWALRSGLDDLGQGVGSFISHAAAYGWALNSMSDYVPMLRGLKSLAELEISDD